jgi:hypothetical protein
VRPTSIPSHINRIPFVPAGAVTGIGSLPFTSVTSAIRAVAELSAEVPFWPQLPQLSERESAISQGLGIVADLIEPLDHGHGYQVKAGQIDFLVEALYRSNGEVIPSRAVGFDAFEKVVLSERFDSAAAVKGQLAGPITLSSYLFHQDRSFLSDPALLAAVAFHVSQSVRWQVDRLQSARLPVLLFVDEPALCMEATAHAVSEEKRLDALAVTLEDARLCGAYAGLHCCEERPFERMLRARPDVLSFDAHLGLDLFFADSRALDYVRRGGLVAYGLVPTRRDLEPLDPASIFRRWLEAVSSAGDPRDFARGAMITATCGLGLLNESSVATSFKVAHGVGELIRALAGENQR